MSVLRVLPITIILVSSLSAGWMKSYGDMSIEEEGRFIKTTSDAGYMIAGSMGHKMWILKLDASGDTVWHHGYLRKTANTLAAGGDCIIEIPNSAGYIVAGTAFSGTFSFDIEEHHAFDVLVSSVNRDEVAVWMLKLSSNGMPIWDRAYPGKHGSTASNMCSTFDGCYAAIGSTIDTTKKEIMEHLNIVKSTVRGEEVWNKIYMTDSNTSGLDIEETDDKGLIACGSIGKDAWLVKTDSLGGALWTHTLGGKKRDDLYSISQTADAGFLFAGVTESWGAGKSDAWLVRTDSLGDTLWTRTYGGEREDIAYSIVATPDSGAVVAGYTKSRGAGRKDVWLFKVDRDGKLLWENTFGTWQDEEAFSVDATPEAGFILTGYCTVKGSKDLWVIKTNAQGNVN